MNHPKCECSGPQVSKIRVIPSDGLHQQTVLCRQGDCLASGGQQRRPLFLCHVGRVYARRLIVSPSHLLRVCRHRVLHPLINHLLREDASIGRVRSGLKSATTNLRRQRPSQLSINVAESQLSLTTVNQCGRMITVTYNCQSMWQHHSRHSQLSINSAASQLSLTTVNQCSSITAVTHDCQSMWQNHNCHSRLSTYVVTNHDSRLPAKRHPIWRSPFLIILPLSWQSVSTSLRSRTEPPSDACNNSH